MRSPDARPPQISHTEQQSVQCSFSELSEQATQRKTGPITVFNRFDTLGEAWLFGLNQVMMHGEGIQDDAVVARDISLDAERTANLLTQYESPSDETRLNLKLKETLGHFVSIETVSIDDPVIEQFADWQRIDYTRKRYGQDSGSGGYGNFVYGPDNEGLDHIVSKLLVNPSSKSAVINAPNAWSANYGKPPCLTAVDFKIRDDELLMTAMYRSQNVFTKQPGNVLALRDLQETIADRVEVPAGMINLFVASAHIYEPDWETAEKILAQT
ncbi:MAG: hypothetical protein H0W89_06790 [Candidatus Levybacteria bacterium]|nr:hypothetical protein [Candidatus Levybacteria bacterium]